MGEAKFRQAADGYPARVAPIWTEEKLAILDGYLGGFADACKGALGWYGLDLFAGTGLNWSETQGVEIPGSPLIALEAGSPPAERVIAAEQHRRAFDALRHRLAPYGDRADAVLGDANLVIGSLLDRVPHSAPAFAFLDPEGSELHWTTVEAIADHQRPARRVIEQLILFPTDMGFIRLIPEYPEKVTRMYGHDRWKAIHERRQAGEIDADRARDEYVRLYAAGMKQLGYPIVLDKQILRDDRHPMYFLIFASGHNVGRKIMDYCFDQVEVEEPGMVRLFDMKRGPRQKRLGED